MEFMSGNIFVRQHEKPMQQGTVIVGHRHRFDHTTFCRAGALRIELLDLPADAAGIDAWQEAHAAAALRKYILRASDRINWMVIRAGMFHRITALEEGSIFQCIYSHRAPGSLVENESVVRTDPDGTQWVRVNPDILQDTTDALTRAYG
jgi:hypothetical protein